MSSSEHYTRNRSRVDAVSFFSFSAARLVPLNRIIREKHLASSLCYGEAIILTLPPCLQGQGCSNSILLYADDA
jgi:hypothetical protein